MGMRESAGGGGGRGRKGDFAGEVRLTGQVRKAARC